MTEKLKSYITDPPVYFHQDYLTFNITYIDIDCFRDRYPMSVFEPLPRIMGKANHERYKAPQAPGNSKEEWTKGNRKHTNYKLNKWKR